MERRSCLRRPKKAGGGGTVLTSWVKQPDVQYPSQEEEQEVGDDLALAFAFEL